MRSVLVDTSVWIEYFSDGPNAFALDALIDDNLVVINDLILAEPGFTSFRRDYLVW